MSVRKGGWAAHVKVSCDGNCELLEAREVPVPLNVEVAARLVAGIWFAVGDCRMTSGIADNSCRASWAKTLRPHCAQHGSTTLRGGMLALPDARA